MLRVLELSSENVFVPLTVGGGIRDYTDAEGKTWSALDVASQYFRAGADKVDFFFSFSFFLSLFFFSFFLLFFLFSLLFILFHPSFFLTDDIIHTFLCYSLTSARPFLLLSLPLFHYFLK